jgi:hypothetical protein
MPPINFKNTKSLSRIVFVFSRNKLHWGSTTMRAHQLARIVSPHISKYHPVILSSLPSSRIPWLQYFWAERQKPGDIFIFTKYSANKVLPATLEILKKIKCFTCYDYVDTDLRVMPSTGFDIHIAASHSAFNKLNTIQKQKIELNQISNGKVMLLMHNGDERLYNLKDNTNKIDFQMTYLGSRATTFIPQKLEKELTYLEASNEKSMQAAIPLLHRFNFHYCIRSSSKNIAGAVICKPFTKGFNAALLGANLITQRNTDDAVELLGSDYPYFIDSNDEGEIINKLIYAKKSFMSNEWKIALERILNMKNQISPEILTQQLLQIVKSLN